MDTGTAAVFRLFDVTADDQSASYSTFMDTGMGEVMTYTALSSLFLFDLSR